MRSFFSSLVITFLLLAVAATTAMAGPPSIGQAQATAYATATPLPDGRVIYIVQPGDTLSRISVITNVPIAELERLNEIRREDTLVAGTQLVIAIIQPTVSEPTYAFQPSPSPSPLPVTGKGEICVSFFNDVNGDASRLEDAEGLVIGGQISVALADGTEMGSFTTNDLNEPHCFKDIPSGEYNIAAAAPENYNPTSEMNKRLVLEPGQKAFVSFAVQSNKPSNGTGNTDGQGGSPLLAVAGVALLVFAGGMLYFVLRPRRHSRW